MIKKVFLFCYSTLFNCIYAFAAPADYGRPWDVDDDYGSGSGYGIMFVIIAILGLIVISIIALAALAAIAKHKESLKTGLGIVAFILISLLISFVGEKCTESESHSNGSTTMMPSPQQKTMPQQRITYRTEYINVTCPTCNGRRRIVCDICGGRGYVDAICSACEGKGYKFVITHGSGSLKLDENTGEVIVTQGSDFREESTCSNCNGSGYAKVKCEHCYNNFGMTVVPLFMQTDEGTNVCPTCNGSGEIQQAHNVPVYY